MGKRRIMSYESLWERGLGYEQARSWNGSVESLGWLDTPVIRFTTSADLGLNMDLDLVPT
jgi:hypothetical protein